MRTSDIVCSGCVGAQAHLASISSRLSSIQSHRRCRDFVACAPPRVHYLDCGGPLLLTPSGDLDETLITDTVHPRWAARVLLQLVGIMLLCAGGHGKQLQAPGGGTWRPGLTDLVSSRQWCFQGSSGLGERLETFQVSPRRKQDALHPPTHFLSIHPPPTLTPPINVSRPTPALLAPACSPAGYDKLFSECWAPNIGRLLAPKFCADANYTGTCTTDDFKTGHCVGGSCQVSSRNPQGRTNWRIKSSGLPPAHNSPRQVIDTPALCFTPDHFPPWQVTCDATKCKGPCFVCNPDNDTCEPVDPATTCTTGTGAAGHCVSGICKVKKGLIRLLHLRLCEPPA